MGPALQAAFLVMQDLGGKLLLFQNAVPSLGAEPLPTCELCPLPPAPHYAATLPGPCCSLLSCCNRCDLVLRRAIACMHDAFCIRG